VSTDEFYDVQAGNQVLSCDENYFDEQFFRGAKQAIRVRVDETTRHFIASYTAPAAGGSRDLTYAFGDDGSFHVLSAGGEELQTFPRYDWFEIATRRYANTE
jgi:hypothetical protein